MKKINYLLVAALSVLFAACNDGISDFSEQSNSLENNGMSLKNGGIEATNEYVYDFIPDKEFFYALGDLHNEGLDYMLAQLSSLPITQDGVLPIELDLLNDYVFHHVLDFLEQEYEFSQEDLAACNEIWNSEHYETNYLNQPQLSSPLVSEYWNMAASIIESESLTAESMVNELDDLFNFAYGMMDMENLTAEEFNFLSYLTITKSSLEYWIDNGNMSAYLNVYKFPETWTLTPNRIKTYAKADGRGAIARGIAAAATGCWFLIPLAAIVSSAVAALNDALSNEITSYEEINQGELVWIGDKLVVYKGIFDNYVENYNLFDATSESGNPYLTGNYENFILPANLFYDFN